MSLPRVVLQPRRARPFYGRHPWVYPGAISRIEGEPADGAEVDLCSHANDFVARGFINQQSKIRVRLYSWSPDTPLDHAFFRQRLEEALRLRQDLGLTDPAGACRLVFSEADQLSGLTLDRYGEHLVVQFTSLALAQRREMLVELLCELLQPKSVYLRTERGIGQLEGLDLQDGPLWGEPPIEPIVIREHGLKFLVHLSEGQKTGFYLDQRDNRLAAAHLAQGRRVLDAFCYSGGFGLYASQAGASAVLGLDMSAPALALAQENVRLNALQGLTFEQADVFERMLILHEAGDRFGMVVLDPPKFARNRNAVEEAMRGYRRLQRLGLRLLEKGGILVICCCSGLISMAMLEELLAQLVMEERRGIQILERRGQAADHPVSVSCPESNYLKCLICRVL